MLDKRSSTETNPDNIPFLFAFKPRQVLLAEHNRKMVTTAAKKDDKISTLNPEKKHLIHQSILRYLQSNGFPKTLKRFLSEAQIENDTWKASSLDLEDMCCKYMDACTHSDTCLNTYKEPELVTDRNGNCATDEKITKKKKEKGSVENDSIAMEDQSKANDKKVVESVKNCGKISADIAVTEPEAKPKEKKRSKSNLDSPVQIKEVKSDVGDDTAHKFKIDDSTKRPKDKRNKTDSIPEVKHKDKKKKKKSSSDSPVEDVEHCGLSNKQEITVDSLVADPARGELAEKKVDSKEKKKKKEGSISQGLADGSDQVNPARTNTESAGLQPSDDATKKEKKSSKKRKRLASDENENQNTEVKTIEEPKRRKTEGPEEGKHEGLLLKEDGMFKESKEENVQVDGHPNGKLEMNGGEKSGSQKAMRKQSNGSAEPKSANAFQRVKIDEVVFAHEKLQDNSYWAKDGANVGYGAKAQEVLGQVKGRDFRHEKTKKKRGSYRGGQIDLQSHSIKFNYSDED